MSLEGAMGDAERANEVENRLIDFAVRVIKVADSLPKSPAGRHICRAELLKAELLTELIDENEQLCRILNASAKTANKNKI